MALRLILDHQYLVPLAEHSDLSRADITLRREDETGSAQPALAGDITFYSKSYELIADKLIRSPTAQTNVVYLTLNDDCCDQILYQGKITADLIDFCVIEDGKPSPCAVTVTSESYTDDDSRYKCLESSLVSANYKRNDADPGFRYRMHPFIRYCYKVRPTILHDLILILGSGIYFMMITLYPLFLVLEAVFAVINFFCNCIDTDPDSEGQQGILNFYKKMLQDIANAITGCGEGGLSPYVRSYVENVCEQCGLQFRSSILNDQNSAYYNLVYFSLPATDGDSRYLNDQGQPRGSVVRRYFDYNAPLDNGHQFLESLRDIFNAQWWIENGVLYFEPKRTNAPVWIDFSAKSGIQSLCFKYSDRRPPAYAQFVYAADAVDIVGNEAKWIFSDIVDYNIPPNANLSGGLKKTFQFGSQRYRDDGDERDPLKTWSFLPLIAMMLRSEFDNNMYLENGSCFNPKLLIHDTATGLEYARVVKLQAPSGHYYYNYPMWFAEGNDPPESVKPKPLPGNDWNLYRFWRQEDPRLTEKIGVNFTVSFLYSCEDLQRLFDLGIGSQVLIPYGGQTRPGVISEIKLSRNLIEVEGRL